MDTDFRWLDRGRRNHRPVDHARQAARVCGGRFLACRCISISQAGSLRHKRRESSCYNETEAFVAASVDGRSPCK